MTHRTDEEAKTYIGCPRCGHQFETERTIIAAELRRMNRLWFLKEKSELSREMTWKEHWDELHKIMED